MKKQLPELPVDQIELHMMIQEARVNVAAAEHQLHALLDACKHVSVIKRHDSAYCQVCRYDFGWWCPISPDHACHYESITNANGVRFVELINGERIVLPKDLAEMVEPEYETEDTCLFCHDPSERK